ncbi:MAG: hypothetical protein KKF30_15130 [Proteobacteria bacterium]|nr:hypothetical protein [Pseudomonadota bacterium]MBU4469728.1 hypothetical protein [Pseudomonadota bacterium]MCG2751809.1 hypothetical protein [Desulfobacteraceae bacterium]
MKKVVLLLAGVSVLCLMLLSCGGGGSSSSNTSESEDTSLVTIGEANAENDLIVTERSREDASSEDVAALVTALNEFGLELYKRQAKDDESISISPYSISLVISAASAGSTGQTLEEILSAMQFPTPLNDLHSVFNHLDLEITGNASPGKQTPLKSIPSAWGQKGYSVFLDYYNRLTEYYGMAFTGCDFAAEAQDARGAIELWSNEHSVLGFSDPTGSLSVQTRLVLSNLTSFEAVWDSPFNPDLTHEDDFIKLNESKVATSFLSQEGIFPYAEENGLQAVEIPFEGGEISVLIILPEADEFQTDENELTALEVQRILSLLEPTRILLEIPSFSLDSKYFPKDDLSVLGMTAAFDKTTADFSGANAEDTMFITRIISQTKHRVNETGWIGEASTHAMLKGVAVSPNPIGFVDNDYNAILIIMPILEPVITPPPAITAAFNHPFIYIIRDVESGTILFMGRFMEPKSN